MTTYVQLKSGTIVRSTRHIKTTSFFATLNYDQKVEVILECDDSYKITLDDNTKCWISKVT